MQRLQLLDWINARGDGDHRHSEFLRGMDVVGSVADKAGLCVAAETVRGLLHGVAEDVSAKLVVIAEASDSETVADSGSLQLGPADPLQVAGANAHQLSFDMQSIQQLANGRAELRAKLIGMLFDLTSHQFLGLNQAVLEAFASDAAEGSGGAQDPDIGIAMNGDIINPRITLIDVLQRRMEGVVMHPVAAVEQGAVNIE